MLTVLLALTFGQAAQSDKFDPGPNPNKSIPTPVIDFESATLRKRLKLENAADEEILKGIAAKVKEWNFDDLEKLSRPGLRRPVYANEIIYLYFDYFDIKQLRPWLIKKAEREEFHKIILHKTQKLDQAKIEFALMDFQDKMTIRSIYSWVGSGHRIGDMPFEMKLIVSRNKHLFDVDELDEWGKGAAERRAKMKAKADEQKMEEEKQQEKMQEVQKEQAEKQKAQDAKDKAAKTAIEEEEKAAFLLKSAKRWLDENNKEVAERRIKELLQRFPKSKSADEARKLLEKLKK